MRMIKSLKAQKSHKFLSIWFPTIAKMLAKVIDDENKLQVKDSKIMCGYFKEYHVL